MAAKRIVWREDGLVSLKLRGGLYAIAQMLKSPYMRFFDVTSEDGGGAIAISIASSRS